MELRDNWGYSEEYGEEIMAYLIVFTVACI